MKAAKIILAVFIIALLIFSIWFCLPKSADTLLGGGEITGFSCLAIQNVFVYDGEHASTRHDIWEAGYETNTEKTAAQLMEILSSSRYRPMLKTLSRPTSFELNGEYSVDLILIMSDGSAQTIYFMGDDLVLFGSSPFNLILRPTDRNVCTRLAEFIKEIGEQT